MRVKGCEVVKNAHVFGLKESIRGAKFPMATDVDKLTDELTPGIKALATSGQGEGHDNWLNGPTVQFDLTFTVKAWTEAERYHFFDFISSQSTMHRITKFNLNESYISYVDPRIIEIMQEKVDDYNKLASDPTVSPEVLKELYLEILYSNPAGFKLTANMRTDYRQLKTIYQQRKKHRLPEWRMFCKWIETLPEADLITTDIHAEDRNAKEIIVELANKIHPDKHYTMTTSIAELRQAIMFNERS